MSPKTTEATVDAYSKARINGLRSALAILAVFCVIALFVGGRIPTTQPKGNPAESSD